MISHLVDLVSGKMLFLSFTLIGISLLTSDTLFASGRKVSILLNDGNLIVGELLVVTDSVFIISKSIGVSQDQLEADTGGIVKIRKSDIRQLTICGKSYVPDGVLLGAIFGIGVGAVLSYEPTGTEAYGSNFDPQGAGPTAIIIGLAGGAVVGGFVGVMATTKDEEAGIDGRKSINDLKKSSRYYDRTLPEFIERHLEHPSLHQ